MTAITTVEELHAIYGAPGEASLVKVSGKITPQYRALIDASPFVALATVGPQGLDCSPRGDAGSVVIVQDDKTLLLPDRRGNNRIDSLLNIVRDPRIALLFLIPGSGTTLRLNGTAHISAEPTLLASLARDGKPPRSVIVIEVKELYFQCARAIVRSCLWDASKFIDPKSLPTPGDILAQMSDNRVGGDTYDREWPERAKASLW